MRAACLGRRHRPGDEVAKDFIRMRELMLSSVTLSGEEYDRLLRYQTTWERRLSSAIGELLALQAKNVK